MTTYVHTVPLPCTGTRQRTCHTVTTTVHTVALLCTEMWSVFFSDVCGSFQNSKFHEIPDSGETPVVYIILYNKYITGPELTHRRS